MWALLGLEGLRTEIPENWDANTQSNRILPTSTRAPA